MTWLVRIRRKEKLHKKQKSCFKHHHYRIIIQQVILYRKNEKPCLSEEQRRAHVVNTLEIKHVALNSKEYT